MENLEVGQRVKVPVHLLGGPFPDQLLAMIRFDGKNVSGVLSKTEVFEVEGRNGFVRGEVAKLKDDSVVLRVPKGLSGSNFTRSGKATVPLTWAKENLVADPGT